jgi:hypothetical protein
VAIFLPWIFGFSPPTGPNYTISLVATPNLIDLVVHCGYPILVAIPVALALGVAFVLIPQRGGKRGKVFLIASAFALTIVSSIIFVVQFGDILMWDGTAVSSSTIYAHGLRVIMVSSVFYLLSLLVTLAWD